MKNNFDLETGAEIQRYCPNCGRGLSGNQKFCTKLATKQSMATKRTH